MAENNRYCLTDSAVIFISLVKMYNPSFYLFFLSLIFCPLLAYIRLNDLNSAEARAQDGSFVFLFSSAIMGLFSVFFSLAVWVMLD